MLAIWRSSSRCASVAASGTSRTNSRSTGTPSMASKSTAVSRCRTALIGALQPDRRQWGMAMPLPKPVEPSFSRAMRFSKMSWASRSGRSRATRLAICSSTRFLLPPGTFTRERAGVRMVSSRIIWEGLSASRGALQATQLLFLVLDQLSVEFVGQQVDGRIHIFVLGVGYYLTAGNVQGRFDLLLQLLDLHDDLHIGDL